MTQNTPFRVIDQDNCFLGGRMPTVDGLAAVLGMHRHESGEIEIGYLVRHDLHGRGLATEAAAGLIAELERQFPGANIVAECRPCNRNSWRILEKLDFEPTDQSGKREGRVKLARKAHRQSTTATSSA